MNKILYFDTETTGLNAYKNDIIQIAGIIEIDGTEVERFNFHVQPFNYDNIDESALKVNNITVEQIRTFPEPQKVFPELVRIFDKYVNKFDKTDVMLPCGYNVEFDVKFLSQFFKRNGNDYCFSYIKGKKDPFQVLDYLRSNGIITGSLKLKDAYKTLFGKDMTNAHDAMGDVLATRDIAKEVDKRLKWETSAIIDIAPEVPQEGVPICG